MMMVKRWKNWQSQFIPTSPLLPLVEILIDEMQGFWQRLRLRPLKYFMSLQMIETIQNKLNWHLNTWLIISLIILNVLDFETTLIAFDQGATEANPLLDYLITATGTTWAILWFKAFALGLLFIPYLFVQKYRAACQTERMVWIFGALNFIYLGVVISNIAHISA